METPPGMECVTAHPPRRGAPKIGRGLNRPPRPRTPPSVGVGVVGGRRDGVEAGS